MQRFFNSIFGIFILGFILISVGFVYTVDETEQIIITQFGKPIGPPISEAGLKFKYPWYHINRFDKRILQWDGDPNQIPTLDKRYIRVDTMARWRIVDPLRFMQSVGTEIGAQARLDDIIDAETRNAISSVILVEAIRSSNRLLDAQTEGKDEQTDLIFDEIALERIRVGREKLTRDILKRSTQEVSNYGIKLVDVQIKRINYEQKVQQKVFERMVSERNRAAERYRSEGQGKKAEIEGQRGKELKEIRSQAYKTAEEIKGKADAEAIKIYADAYNNDPEFYSFTKALETYQKAINEDTVLILSTDSDLFSYLKSIKAAKVSSSSF